MIHYDKSLNVCSNYLQYKSCAMLSIKKNLKLKVNDNCNNKVNNYLHSSCDSIGSSNDSECDCDSHSGASENECDNEIKYYLKNKANISFDISSLYISLNDYSNILQYWKYRFNSIDLIVVYKFKSIEIGTKLSHLLNKPLLILERDDINNTYNHLNSINLNEIVQQQQQLNNNNQFHILIMNEVLKEGKSLATTIEYIKKSINKFKNNSTYKISSTTIASIKSMNGKEHIYERYNDVNVDTIFEI